MKAWMLLLVWVAALIAQQGVYDRDAGITKPEDQQIEAKIPELDDKMFTPFVELYVLEELKLLRQENRDLKVELFDTITQKELKVARSAIDYATSTINNMFYIIAAASSILVLLGWNSLRDVNDRIKNTVEEQINRLIRDNETRMNNLEVDLAERSHQVLKNQEEIAKTNTIHSLWMRAGLESTPNGKIEIYDHILSMRPNDAEVLSYKADAALEMGEANWALSLANQALSIDETYPNALYQRACAFAVLGYPDNAIDDLEKALEDNEYYIEEIMRDRAFESIREAGRFVEIIEKYTKEVPIKPGTPSEKQES